MESQSVLTTLRELAPLDLVGLGLIAVLIVLGIWRGLWWQVIRLVGLALAVALARVFSPEVAQWTQEFWPSLEPRSSHGIAWVSVFVLTLGAASILGLLGQRLIEAMQLGVANRIGGGVIGAVTGVLVHLALLVMLCQLAPEGFVSRYVAGTYSELLVQEAGQRWRVVLGAEAADEVNRVIGRDRPPTDTVEPTSSERGVVR